MIEKPELETAFEDIAWRVVTLNKPHNKYDCYADFGI
jgi:hypothetical protein